MMAECRMPVRIMKGTSQTLSNPSTLDLIVSVTKVYLHTNKVRSDFEQGSDAGEDFCKPGSRPGGAVCVASVVPGIASVFCKISLAVS